MREKGNCGREEMGIFITASNGQGEHRRETSDDAQKTTLYDWRKSGRGMPLAGELLDPSACSLWKDAGKKKLCVCGYAQLLKDVPNQLYHQ